MTKIKNTTQLTLEILAPLIKHCANNRGQLAEVARRFNAGLKEPVPMNSIYRWLKPDEKKWSEPTGGNLLRLLTIWIALRGPDCENKAPDNIYCTVNGHTPSRNGLNCLKCGHDL